MIITIMNLNNPPYILCRETNPPNNIYYVRFDIKSANNRIVRSNLLMVPAEDEFRMEKFTLFVISGDADESAHGKTGMDIQTRAEHNAIKNLLERHGLESVKTQSGSVNGLAHSETVVSFEGAVKLPYKRTKSYFDKEKRVNTVTIEILFAPLVFPDKWEDMKVRHRIKTIFKNFMGWF
ncbi:hypothetical protein [Desulfamplus magnetovallimortis]|uniref:hypothetical protein n=1 Tax=Desulfamplus magnetovallimortis TaxID=1246637 RepID=UPI00111886F0|nr:hypothetical protein [Desulfamplus magnetovallimortis]